MNTLVLSISGPYILHLMLLSHLLTLSIAPERHLRDCCLVASKAVELGVRSEKRRLSSRGLLSGSSLLCAGGRVGEQEQNERAEQKDGLKCCLYPDLSFVPKTFFYMELMLQSTALNSSQPLSRKGEKIM